VYATRAASTAYTCAFARAYRFPRGDSFCGEQLFMLEPAPETQPGRARQTYFIRRRAKPTAAGADVGRRCPRLECALGASADRSRVRHQLRPTCTCPQCTRGSFDTDSRFGVVDLRSKNGRISAFKARSRSSRRLLVHGQAAAARRDHGLSQAASPSTAPSVLVRWNHRSRMLDQDAGATILGLLEGPARASGGRRPCLP
jgi:hypothetical protein